MNLLENVSLIPKTMHRLWKEPKFHDRIDTPPWRRPIDSRSRMKYYTSLSDLENISCYCAFYLIRYHWSIWYFTHLMKSRRNKSVPASTLHSSKLHVPLPAVAFDYIFCWEDSLIVCLSDLLNQSLMSASLLLGWTMDIYHRPRSFVVTVENF